MGILDLALANPTGGRIRVGVRVVVGEGTRQRGCAETPRFVRPPHGRHRRGLAGASPVPGGCDGGGSISPSGPSIAAVIYQSLGLPCAGMAPAAGDSLVRDLPARLMPGAGKSGKDPVEPLVPTLTKAGK